MFWLELPCEAVGTGATLVTVGPPLEVLEPPFDVAVEDAGVTVAVDSVLAAFDSELRDEAALDRTELPDEKALDAELRDEAALDSTDTADDELNDEAALEKAEKADEDALDTELKDEAALDRTDTADDEALDAAEAADDRALDAEDMALASVAVGRIGGIYENATPDSVLLADDVTAAEDSLAADDSEPSEDSALPLALVAVAVAWVVPRSTVIVPDSADSNTDSAFEVALESEPVVGADATVTAFGLVVSVGVSGTTTVTAVVDIPRPYASQLEAQTRSTRV